jgi:hypothetical protein
MSDELRPTSSQAKTENAIRCRLSLNSLSGEIERQRRCLESARLAYTEAWMQLLEVVPDDFWQFQKAGADPGNFVDNVNERIVAFCSLISEFGRRELISKLDLEVVRNQLKGRSLADDECDLAFEHATALFKSALSGKPIRKQLSLGWSADDGKNPVLAWRRESLHCIGIILRICEDQPSNQVRCVGPEGAVELAKEIRDGYMRISRQVSKFDATSGTAPKPKAFQAAVAEWFGIRLRLGRLRDAVHTLGLNPQVAPTAWSTRPDAPEDAIAKLNHIIETLTTPQIPAATISPLGNAKIVGSDGGAKKTDRAPEGKGPFALGCLDWGGQRAEGIPTDQWKLLKALFDGPIPHTDVVSDATIIEAVYGKEADDNDEAIKSLRRRLNDTLASKHIRAEIERPRKAAGYRFLPYSD